MPQVSTELRQWLDQHNRMMTDLLAKGFKATPTNTREAFPFRNLLKAKAFAAEHGGRVLPYARVSREAIMV